MAKKKKAKKKAVKNRKANGAADEHVLDRLYAVISGIVLCVLLFSLFRR